MNRFYRFFYHYNKPASLKAGHPCLSVHWRGKCYVVDSVRCLVPCSSHHQKRQPRCEMRGVAARVTFVRHAPGSNREHEAIIASSS